MKATFVIILLLPKTVGGSELKRRRYSLQVDLIRRLRAIAKQWRSRGDCVVHLQEISSPLFLKHLVMGGVKCSNAGKLSPFPYHRHINQQNHVHQQCINDCRDGHLAAVEDEGRGGYGNSLGSVLHPYLNNNGASDSI